MQPTPDWPSIHNDPKALNIRSGVFWMEREQQYEVYLMSGNDKLFGKQFDTLTQALEFLNHSTLEYVDGTVTLVPQKPNRWTIPFY